MTEGLAKKKGHGSFLRIAKDEGDRRSARGKRRREAEEKVSAVFDEEADSFDIPESSPEGRKSGRARRGASRSDRGRPKSLLLPVFVLGILAILIAGAIAIVPGALLLRRVVVAGTTSLAAGEVVAASGVRPGKPLLSNDLGLVERNLEAWAPVAGAKASYILPDAIRLEIVERKAVALVLVEEGQTMVPVSIDSQGYAFAKASPADAIDLPLLSGIRFDAWKPGTRLPAYLLPTIGSIAALGGKDPTLLSLFSEIRVERTNWGEVELVLFPLHHAIPVRTGPKLDAALLRSIVLVLDALDKGGIAPKVGELDFRSGTIVFRSKEGSPG